ncbi:PCI domain-containing protein [Jimgerdemannia flammicorona]|nr:PCI domain-containing protein [Jimgerdemannia flammicorona]
MDNNEFKNFLELEPHIRELIHSFYHSNYKTCLEILENSKNDLLLDLHLHSHVEMLYENIRKKALVQYFSPFQSVDLNRMAASFSTDVRRLESELALLITDNQIQARIDSHKKILCAKQQDQRSHVFEKSLTIGTDYDKATRALLLRFNMVKADLVVRPPKEI